MPAALRASGDDESGEPGEQVGTSLPGRCLSRTLVLGAMSLAACMATHGGSVRAGYRFYSDDTVDLHSPRVDGSLKLSGSVEVSPHWTADVISAATPVANAPDVISRATEYSEARHEGGIGLRWAPAPESAVEAGYVVSVEPDYLSHTASIGGSREVLDRHTTLGATARMTVDRVGRSDIDHFSEALDTYAADLVVSQILSQTMVLHAAYTLEQRAGFQSNPYRYVYLHGPGEERPTFALAELLPDRRTRHALELGNAWSLHRDVYLQGSYRLYSDSWQLLSHTLRAELWHVLADDRVRLRWRVRAYTQSGAEFYRRRYTDIDGYRTGDFRLSAMSTLSLGSRAEVRVRDVAGAGPLALSAGYDWTGFDLREHLVRDGMHSHLISVGISMEFQ